MKARNHHIPLALAIVIPLLLSSQLSAAVSGFIKIGDVKGEAQQAGYEDYSEVNLLSWGVERDGSDHRSSPSFADLTISKPVDKATPKLFEACATGTIFGECKIVLVRPIGSTGQEGDYMHITLKNVLVTSAFLDVPSADERPTETLSLNYTEVTMEYFVGGSSTDSEGIVEMSYNLQDETP